MRSLFLTLLLLAGSAGVALAQTGTDSPGSLLVFPLISSNNTEKTVVQISNAAATAVALRCFYINGAPAPGTGLPLWSVTDFQIKLTPLQPTVWTAGEGLPPMPPDMRQPGLYPGPVPPVDEGFLGELRCVVVSANESPISRNVLTGEATIVEVSSGVARKYQATAFQGLPGNNGDNILALDDSEYSSCPRLLLLNHFFEGALDPITNLPVTTRLTMVPCSVDYETSLPNTSSVQFTIVNELEQKFSASIEVVCFSSLMLSEISRTVFDAAVQGTLVGQTRIRGVVDGNTRRGHAVIGIAEEFRGAGGPGTAMNLHTIGGNLQADVVVLSGTF